MAYFPHAYCKTLLGSASTPVVGSGSERTTALQAGELGIVIAKTHKLADVGTLPTDSPLFYLAQGSFYQNDKLGPHHGGYQETVKTKGINPKYVSKLYKTVSANAMNDVVQIVVAPDCTQVACDTTYYLRLDAKGSPALRHLTRNAYVNAPAYSGCCDANNTEVDPAVIALGWADYINDHAPIAPFVQANALDNINRTPAATVSASAAANLTLSAAIAHAIGDRVVFEQTAAPVATAGAVDGYTFTPTTVAAGMIFSVGMVLTGTNIAPGTKIVKLVSGDGGAGSVFEVDKFNATASAGNVTGEKTVIAYADNAGTTTLSLVAAADAYTATATDIANVNVANATAVKVWRAIDSATHVPKTGSDVQKNEVILELVSAYADTQFGDCSFNPKDHFEKEPIEIYASIVDESGDSCSSTCFSVVEVQDARQGKGYGETVLREMIQFKRYRQEDFKVDPRLREVLGETVLSDIGRNTKYSALYILHSVPRKANPSGMMDNDQYLVKVCFPDASFANSSVAELEAWIEAACSNAGNDLEFEAIA